MENSKDHKADVVAMLRERAARKWTDGANRSASLFGQAADEIDRLRKAHERYETARRMNPRQWAAAWELNLKTGKPFDEIIDDMRPFMVPNTSKGQFPSRSVGWAALNKEMNMEIKVRDTCEKCDGTGKAMTEYEAWEAASRHNERARMCSAPNFLSAKHFSKCAECDGVGKVERWIPVTDLMPTQKVSRLRGFSRRSARLTGCASRSIRRKRHEPIL